MTEQIKTERLILRPFVEADGDAVVRALGNYEVSKWLARVPHPFTHADLRIVNDDGTSRWPDLMAITQAGAVIGGISSGDHLGYWLDPVSWGRGFATEAARGVVEHAFAVRGMNQLESGHFRGNSASANVLAKLGFQVISEDMLFNRAQDAELPNYNLLLTRADWEANR